MARTSDPSKVEMPAHTIKAGKDVMAALKIVRETNNVSHDWILKFALLQIVSQGLVSPEAHKKIQAIMNENSGGEIYYQRELHPQEPIPGTLVEILQALNETSGNLRDATQELTTEVIVATESLTLLLPD